MGKSVLVMGGTRFVGLHIIMRLLDKGYKVTALNRGTRPDVLPQEVMRLSCDRKDPNLLREVLSEALANGHFDAVIDPSAYMPSDILPLLDILKGQTGSYVFISTGSVYKARELYPWYEDMPRVTDNFQGDYGYNKKLCEDALLHAFHDYGFPAVIIRPGYIYGPHNTVYREAYFFDRILLGRPVLVPGNGTVLSQFGYVDDLANLAILAMENPKALGQAYNFSGKYMRNLDEYVQACASAVARCAHDNSRKYRPEIVHYNPDELGISDQEVSRIFPYRWRVHTVRDISKARYDLGYDEHFSLEKGLEEACRWYLMEIQRGVRPFPVPDFSLEDSVLQTFGLLRRAANNYPQ
ncbi:MAG: SDR family oxidoreductase [Bacillota bacterium]